MPIKTAAINLFKTREELLEFLLICRQKLTEEVRRKIVSISLAIPPVEPLTVLQEFLPEDPLHFYWEKQAARDGILVNKRVAIAAIDSATYLTVESGNRFQQCQDFIKSCVDRTISVGTIAVPFSGPHFFCSFTFFEDNFDASSPFPPATIFLPSFQISKSGDRCTLVVNIEIDLTTDIDRMSRDLWNQIKQIVSTKNNPLFIAASCPSKFKKVNLESPRKFKQSLASALELIDSNYFKKIVLAKAIDIRAKAPFNLIASLNNLRQIYPDCYVFSIGNGKGQNFIGASPEKLIGIEGDRLITDALAGSAPRSNSPSKDAELANSLLSSKKDLREHFFVRNFIVKSLEELGFLPICSPQPRLLQLSNIQHLWTPIKAGIFGDVHILEIVAKLHPTPAVAGVPRDLARAKIRQLETVDRSLYAAPIGWIDSKGNGEFAVGIRSGLIDGDRARLYAGAGIVMGSRSYKEWAEIQLKFQALLKALV
ncbi:MAG: isochorismate synthase [Cyanobacteriota bacterium]|nr:isochorismate synthase [Cyanobacteriota bacterium]